MISKGGGEVGVEGGLEDDYVFAAGFGEQELELAVYGFVDTMEDFIVHS